MITDREPVDKAACDCQKHSGSGRDRKRCRYHGQCGYGANEVCADHDTDATMRVGVATTMREREQHSNAQRRQRDTYPLHGKYGRQVDGHRHTRHAVAEGAGSACDTQTDHEPALRHCHPIPTVDSITSQVNHANGSQPHWRSG